MTPKQNPQLDSDGTPYGFCLNTQKLHCLIVLHDGLAHKLSDQAGDAYYRAFVVQDRKTGEVFAKQRFRYVHEDSWFEIHLAEDKRRWPVKEQVEWIAATIETVMRTGLKLAAGGAKPPKEAVTLFYPPNPDNSGATLEWLIQQDLIEIRKIVREDGSETVVSKEGHA